MDTIYIVNYVNNAPTGMYLMRIIARVELITHSYRIFAMYSKSTFVY